MEASSNANPPSHDPQLQRPTSIYGRFSYLTYIETALPTLCKPEVVGSIPSGSTP
jgi:hypothetical protein